MPTEAKPSWLTIQEHGVLAEARTRAFLLDRFWVLERSVDVEGADFIIQRRLTGRSLLDPSPPRLGFIQAKFYASGGTTQYIHKEYVVDSAGAPRAEFFLMCHMGNEDDKRSFLLSAVDIKNFFRETDAAHSRPGRFALPGSEVLLQRFEVLDQGRALNQIDKALRDADFYKNRSFFSWALPRNDSTTPILPMYEETIDNWWGEIPHEFNKLRERARRAQWELEEVLNKLREMEESPDPEKVLGLAEDLWHEYRDHVSLPADLWDEDFFSAVKYHKKRFTQLSEAGLLGAHACMRRAVKRHMIDEIAPRMPMARNDVYVLRMRYDANTFLRVHYESRFAKAPALWPTKPPDCDWGPYKDIPNTVGVLASSPGDIEVYLLPGRYSYDRFEKGKRIVTDEPWPEKIGDVIEAAVAKLLIHVLDLRFGE
jgi:hypothetical protein